MKIDAIRRTQGHCHMDFEINVQIYAPCCLYIAHDTGIYLNASIAAKHIKFSAGENYFGKRNKEGHH